MAEEFQESEVVFQENLCDDEDSDFQLNLMKRKNNNKQKKKDTAAPVNIPENGCRKTWLRCMDAEVDGGDDREMVPPHVIVGRRVAGKMMAFSVCTGNGRTLKGRDLSEVRNSILRMTGFLES